MDIELQRQHHKRGVRKVFHSFLFINIIALVLLGMSLYLLIAATVSLFDSFEGFKSFHPLMNLDVGPYCLDFLYSKLSSVVLIQPAKAESQELQSLCRAYIRQVSGQRGAAILGNTYFAVLVIIGILQESLEYVFEDWKERTEWLSQHGGYNPQTIAGKLGVKILCLGLTGEVLLNIADAVGWLEPMHIAATRHPWLILFGILLITALFVGLLGIWFFKAYKEVK